MTDAKRNEKASNEKQEDASKLAFIQKFYISILIFVVFFTISIVIYLAIIVAPAILNGELGLLPVNGNDIYPILLQGLIIVAGIIISLFAVLLSKLIPDSAKLAKKFKLSSLVKVLFYSVISFIVLLLYLSLIFSIFYSINGMIYYGKLSTYITQTSINQIPNLVEQNLSVVVMNSSYFNNSIYKNYTKGTNQTYHALLSSARISVKYLFVGFALLLLSIIFYVVIHFEVLNVIKDIWDRGIWSEIGLFFIFLLASYPILYYINSANFIPYVIITSIIFVVIIIAIVISSIRQRRIDKNKNEQKPNPPQPIPSSQV